MFKTDSWKMSHEISSIKYGPDVEFINNGPTG